MICIENPLVLANCVYGSLMLGWLKWAEGAGRRGEDHQYLFGSSTYRKLLTLASNGWIWSFNLFAVFSFVGIVGIWLLNLTGPLTPFRYYNVFHIALAAVIAAGVRLGARGQTLGHPIANRMIFMFENQKEISLHIMTSGSLSQIKTVLKGLPQTVDNISKIFVHRRIRVESWVFARKCIDPAVPEVAELREELSRIAAVMKNCNGFWGRIARTIIGGTAHYLTVKTLIDALPTPTAPKPLGALKKMEGDYGARLIQESPVRMKPFILINLIANFPQLAGRVNGFEARIIVGQTSAADEGHVAITT
jgi:hypothetical protein